MEKKKVITTGANERALHAGLEVFPTHNVGTRETMFGPQPIDANEFKRACFIEGFRRGENETIRRAIEWMKNNCEQFIWFSEIDRDCGMEDNFWDAFQKAMEE